MKRGGLPATRTDSGLDEQFSAAAGGLHADLKAEFVRAAEACGVPIDREEIAIVASGTSLLMNARRVGLEKFTVDQFNDGVDIGFIFIGRSTGSHHRVPDGFYAVRPSSHGMAALRSATGAPVIELPLRLESNAHFGGKGGEVVQPLGFSAHDLGNGCYEFDWEIRLFVFKHYALKLEICDENE